MKRFTKKTIFSIALIMVGGALANAQNKENNEKFASEMRDSTAWKNYNVMPPLKKPARRKYDNSHARHAINMRHAEAMRDTANWKTYQVMPPLKPETINATTMAKNIKVR